MHTVYEESCRKQTMEQKHILFIQADSRDEVLGLMTLSSILREAGFSTEIIEADYYAIKERLEYNPSTILAYSLLTVFYQKFLRLNRKLKEEFPDALSVFGGPHPTFSPEMINEEGVDGVCRGEGEFALLELIRNFADKKPITNIRNWWIKQHTQIHKNPLRPLIEDLDCLPFADRRYSMNFLLPRNGVFEIAATRGCIFSCPYCCNHVYNRLYNTQGKIRHRSVKNVIEEIQRLKATFTVKKIAFIDDMFISDMLWIEEFSFKYKREIGLPFFANARLELVNSDTVKLLKNAGCEKIAVGIECADDDYRKNVLRRELPSQQILHACRILREQGIKVVTYNIIGLPGTDLNFDIRTIGLNVQCKPSRAIAQIFSPYPMTEMYNVARENRMTNNNFGSQLSWGGWFLDRNFQNNEERHRLINLTLLFPFLVRFPFFIRLTKILIRLPLPYQYLRKKKRNNLLITLVDNLLVFFFYP